MQPKLLIILSVCFVAFSIFIFLFFIEDPELDDPLIKTLTEQLNNEGYEVLDVSSTLLGRYHIEARSAEFEREIVITPGSGTFLRDEISPLNQDD